MDTDVDTGIRRSPGRPANPSYNLHTVQRTMKMRQPPQSSTFYFAIVMPKRDSSRQICPPPCVDMDREKKDPLRRRMMNPFLPPQPSWRYNHLRLRESIREALDVVLQVATVAEELDVGTIHLDAA